MRDASHCRNTGRGLRVEIPMRSLAAGMLLLSRVAGAEPDHEQDTFLGVDSLGTLGLGVVIDHEDTDPGASYDYTLRVGHVFRATDRWRPGGFLELHSFDLDELDAAIGPQVQYRIHTGYDGQLALQLRGGVGVGGEGTHALAGLHVGTAYVGASVTTRRSFDTGDVVVSMNIELLALVPVAIGIALGAKD